MQIARAEIDRGKQLEIKKIANNTFYELTEQYPSWINGRERSVKINRYILGQLQQAFRMNTNLAEAYYNRGDSFLKLGDYKQAIVNFDRAIEINPKFAKAYHRRAASYSRLGNQKQATEDLKAAALSGDTDAQNLLKSYGIK